MVTPPAWKPPSLARDLALGLFRWEGPDVKLLAARAVGSGDDPMTVGEKAGLVSLNGVGTRPTLPDRPREISTTGPADSRR